MAGRWLYLQPPAGPSELRSKYYNEHPTPKQNHPRAAFFFLQNPNIGPENSSKYLLSPVAVLSQALLSQQWTPSPPYATPII